MWVIVSLHKGDKKPAVRLRRTAGNEKLKNAGRADQASGKVKQAVTRAVDKVKNAVKGKRP